MQLFLDESGNTGANWLDPNQPYFVYGGWLIMDDPYEKAVDIVEKTFSFSKAHELKSKYILTHKRNSFFIMADALMTECYALPVFCVADKRYMIAAKICETFFDCEHNPALNTYITHKTRLKKALADLISEDESLGDMFSNLIKLGTIDITTMRDIKNALVACFDNANLDVVVKSLNNLDDEMLKKMIDEYEFLTDKGTSMKWMALTEPILVNLLICIDGLGHTCESLNINVDNTARGYAPVFKEIEAICKKNTIIKNVKSINIVDSKGNVMIQAADLLSGYIARSLKEISSKENTNEDKEFWNNLLLLREHFVDNSVALWDYCAHESFIETIAKLTGHSCEYVPNQIEIIKKGVSWKKGR